MTVPMIEMFLLPLLAVSFWVTARRIRAAKLVPVRVRRERVAPDQVRR